MHCWARYLFVGVVIALGTLSMLGACGQRGPLVLPDQAGAKAPGKVADKRADVPKAQDLPRPPPAAENTGPQASPTGTK